MGSAGAVGRDEGRGDPETPQRVVVQERSRFVREALAAVLAGAGDPPMTVVATAATHRELVDRCAGQSLDLVVMEVDTGTRCTASLVQALRRSHAGLRVICLHEPGTRRGPAVPGAILLSKSVGAQSLLEAARPRSSARSDDGRAGDGQQAAALTLRQAEVLRLLSWGGTVAEVAEVLRISPGTVSKHKQQAYARLDVQSQAHAIAVATDLGVLEVDQTPRSI